MRPAALVVLAACGGGTGVDGPRVKPVVRVVQCSPAHPHLAPVDGEVSWQGRVDGAELGWAAGERTPRRMVSISFAMASTSGMMDAMTVRTAITTRIADLQQCYERELAADPLAGAQTVSWRIVVAQDGRVRAADSLSRALSPPATSCMQRALMAVKFPVRSTGGSITITQPLTFNAIPIAEKPALVDSATVPWTPFALGAIAPARAQAAARAAERALRGRVEQLERCFGATASGAVRIVFGVDGRGQVAMVRAGGLGDAAVERCMTKQLAGASIANPAGQLAELACDVARGDAQPWRVTPSEGYGVIATTTSTMTHGSQSIRVGVTDPDALPGQATYLIVLDPQSPGAVLSAALAWASEGDATLVALADRPRAPVLLGMGHTRHDDAQATRPMLVLGRSGVQACVGKHTRAGTLSDAGQLALRLATRCKSMRCGTLVIGIDDAALAKDLVELTSAARRAGFERVLLGGRVTCDLEDEAR